MTARDEHGGLTVAGLRAQLEGVPDDAVIVVHDDDADGAVLAVERAYDDGPSACTDDRRHVFRIHGTTDKDTLADAAERDVARPADGASVLPCCDGRSTHGHVGCVWPTGGKPALECLYGTDCGGGVIRPCWETLADQVRAGLHDQPHP